MSIEAAKKNFEVAKKAVEDCQRSIFDLQKKCDSLQESLPGLGREIENAERAKASALDDFVLLNNKESDSRLRQARASHEKAQKDVIETNELIGATHRGLKKQEAELIRLNEQMSVAKRLCWEAVADEIEKKISVDVIAVIQKLIICRTQTGGTRQHVLNMLIPQLNPGEYQSIRENLMEQYRFGD
ncbi:MAG: hypothetical protein CV087_02340 [Candidatus Brocadia sp. WS118]|nr:MAG: hypothetical protein CV087_02340 [Candidatus Brocadia sp. WS118]